MRPPTCMGRACAFCSPPPTRPEEVRVPAAVGGAAWLPLPASPARLRRQRTLQPHELVWSGAGNNTAGGAQRGRVAPTAAAECSHTSSSERSRRQWLWQAAKRAAPPALPACPPARWTAVPLDPTLASNTRLGHDAKGGSRNVAVLMGPGGHPRSTPLLQHTRSACSRRDSQQHAACLAPRPARAPESRVGWPWRQRWQSASRVELYFESRRLHAFWERRRPLAIPALLIAAAAAAGRRRRAPAHAPGRPAAVHRLPAVA